MSVFDNSRYVRSVLYVREDSGTPTLKIRDRFSFSEDNAEVYTWKSSDTLDGVAYKYYGIADLRWAILDANPHYRTEFDIKTGDNILIPAFEEVVEVVDVWCYSYTIFRGI